MVFYLSVRSPRAQARHGSDPQQARMQKEILFS
jgi:hypothetical protein